MFMTWPSIDDRGNVLFYKVLFEVSSLNAIVQKLLIRLSTVTLVFSIDSLSLSPFLSFLFHLGPPSHVPHVGPNRQKQSHF